MITLITGVPGSGKTLYAISKLLSTLHQQTVAVTQDDGAKIDMPRQLFSNIKGLVLDHQLIDANSLETWQDWVKPGDFICFDEVQKVWPQRAVGSKVPIHIAELEEHRHRGVDFLIMTQGAHLVDRNLLALIGRHLHVRRVGNMNLAIVYEWDHCSKSLLFKNAMTKGAWRFDKSVFRLYKSADAHTKTPRSLPASVWFIGLSLCAFSALGYVGVQRFSERTGLGAKDAPASSLTPPEAMLPTTGVDLSAIPPVVAVRPPQAFVSASYASPAPLRVTYKGCIKLASRCQCFDSDGYEIQLSLPACTAALVRLGTAIPIESSPQGPSPVPSPSFTAPVVSPTLPAL